MIRSRWASARRRLLPALAGLLAFVAGAVAARTSNPSASSFQLLVVDASLVLGAIAVAIVAWMLQGTDIGLETDLVAAPSNVQPAITRQERSSGGPGERTPLPWGGRTATGTGPGPESSPEPGPATVPLPAMLVQDLSPEPQFRPVPIHPHRRHRTLARLQRLLPEHGKRFARFGIIGVSVFAGGLGLDVLLVKDAHLAATPAYVTQGLLSIQASFLLNYYWTWRDRRVPFWRAGYRFNAQKAVTAALNFVLYAGLIRLGMNYLVANVLMVSIFTLANYVLGHYWAFCARQVIELPQQETGRSQFAGLAPSQSPNVPTEPSAPKQRRPRIHLPRFPAHLFRRIRVSAFSRSRLPWPLFPILALQASLSLGLIWSNTVFGDEALYLWAGHLEWAHWLHGMRIPPLHFSGAPALYPPIGALASSIGGLACSRILSLLFMLTATGLLYSTACRLFGQRQAIFAAVLWAVSEPALKLGAFATYDSLAALLIVASAWCLTHGINGRWWPVIAATLLMGLGDLTAFAVTIQNLTIAAIAFLIFLPRLGIKKALTRVELLIGGALGLFFAVVLLFNMTHDLIGSTVLRPGGLNQGAYLIARDAWLFTGIIIILAALGAIAGVLTESDRSRAVLLIVLAAAAILVPVYQAKIHTAVSLDKHLASGAWFAAIAAGYALDTLSRSFSLSRSRLVIPVCAIAIIYASVTGFYEAASQFHYWPNMSKVTAVLRPLVSRVHGNILVEQYQAIQQYYLPQGHEWWRWQDLGLSVDTYSTVNWFTAQLKSDNLGLIALNFSGPNDCRLAQAINNDPSYHVIDVVPYGASFHLGTNAYVIWARTTENIPSRYYAEGLVALDPTAKNGCSIGFPGGPHNSISVSIPYGVNSTLITEHIRPVSQSTMGGR
jgi:putative flippase GtrA